jgi:hypothetical protein
MPVFSKKHGYANAISAQRLKPIYDGMHCLRHIRVKRIDEAI